MKKIFRGVLILIAIFCLMGCGGKNKPDDSGKNVESKPKYSITWKDDEGNVLLKQEYEENQIPSYSWEKRDTDEWDYSFVGWSNTKNGSVITIPKVSSNAEYYAVISKQKQKQKYSISWKDDEGNVLLEQEYEEDQIPSYSWEKEDTDEWDYIFVGWSNTKNGSVITIPKVSANAEYYAVVSKQKHEYTLRFVSEKGDFNNNIIAEYNELIEEPEKPTFSGYRFICWCTDEALAKPVEWPLVITKDTTIYASWNTQVNISNYLSKLLDGYALDPYSYIPESMQPGKGNNLVSNDSIITDYSNFVLVNQIKASGYGEQWKMVADNLNQSQTFFNLLSAVETIATSSIITFNNYIDKNPASTASYSFANGIFNVVIDFDGETISFVLDYVKSIAAFGEQSIQIALSMNIETSEKDVRIQIGDANALHYIIKENSYVFAIKYLGVRKAFFEIEKKANGDVEGHINEHLSYSGVGIHSAADFYIGSDYVSVVGNKASGMIGFTGCISELYNTTTGKLLCYEVKESLSSITYNTLWFDLSSINGINSIKYVEKNDTTKAAFYVNNLPNIWATKLVGGLSTKMLSRRFDIEFRKQYFYSYNAQTDSYVEVVADIPMLFVQEENLGTFSADIKSVNSNVTVSIGLSNTILTKIKSDYSLLIDIFNNGSNINEEYINLFIGEKVIFN